jgi:hypothetical protein
MRWQNERTVTHNLSHLKYYFLVVAVATAITGIVHLYMPLIDHSRIFNNISIATFFLDSGIAQLFWAIPMMRR